MLTREHLNRILMDLYPEYVHMFPEVKFRRMMEHRYNVCEVRLMTLEQMRDLIRFMKEQMKKEEEKVV